jgi:hypothetical protein
MHFALNSQGGASSIMFWLRIHYRAQPTIKFSLFFVLDSATVNCPFLMHSFRLSVPITLGPLNHNAKELFVLFLYRIVFCCDNHILTDLIFILLFRMYTWTGTNSLLLKWAFEDPVSEEGVRRETCTLEGDTCIFRRPLSISILGFFWWVVLNPFFKLCCNKLGLPQCPDLGF